MDFPRALSQIAEIHQQLAKSEVYRGYRSLPIAASGLVGVLAALGQPAWTMENPRGFLAYWTAVAALAGTVGVSEIAFNYVVHEPSFGRRRTRQVLGQFLPAAVMAIVVTVTLHQLDQQLVHLLPGLWSLCFGVGIFASRPYLPRRSGLVALYYTLAGSALLWTANLGGTFNGWRVGGTFALGQLMAAAVLYWELEREQPEN
jgi:hypothetical protein